MKTLALLHIWSLKLGGGGSVIESFALGHVFGELEPFFSFFIMADANFLFPLTFGKPEIQTLGELVIGSFALGHISGELEPFFEFFIMADAFCT